MSADSFKWPKLPAKGKAIFIIYIMVFVLSITHKKDGDKLSRFKLTDLYFELKFDAQKLLRDISAENH